jgi:hypothetical protein
MTNDRLKLTEEASAFTTAGRIGACRMRHLTGMSKRREQLPAKAPLDHWIDATCLPTFLDRPGLRLSG